MKAESDNGPRISLLALPESTPAALYGLYEVLMSAGRTWQELTGEPAAGRKLYPRIVASGGQPVSGAMGFPIAPHGDLDAADVVIVADLVLAPDASLAH